MQQSSAFNPAGRLDPIRRLATRVVANRWLLAGILLLGLALRLYSAFVWNSWHPDTAERLSGDEPGYDNLAREMLRGLGFTWPGRVPLYPLLLAGIYLVTGGSYHLVPYIQSFLGVGAVLLTYMLGRRVFGRAAGLLAAFLAACSYVLIQQSVRILDDVLFTPVVLLALLTLWDAFRAPTTLRFAWAGCWVGISSLVRPTLLFFPVALIVVLVIALKRRPVVRYWLVYLVAALLVVLPWAARNYVKYQAIFPLQTSNAILWQGSPEYYNLIHKQGYTYQRIWTEVLYGPGWQAHDPNSIAGDRYWTGRALSSIADEPLVYLRYAAEKLVTYWTGDPNADWANTSVFNYGALRDAGVAPFAATMVMIARALPLAALLAAVALRRHWRLLLPIYAVLVYSTLLHAFTHAEARLSEPLQPLLLVLLSGALVGRAAKRPGEVHRARPAGGLLGRDTSLTRSAGYAFDVVSTLVGRELRIRYKGSVLGLLWAVLSPLGTVAVLHIVFARILPLNIPNYAAYVYSGLLPFTWFQAAVLSGATTLIDNRDLVRKPFFPRPLLPAVVTSTNFILYLLAQPVLLLMLLLEGIPLSPLLLLLPLIWVVQAIFTLACTIFFAALGVLIRDVQHLLGVGMLLWFYLTPVFYDLSLIPFDKARWFALNPMAAIVDAHRAVALHGQMPNWAVLGGWAVAASLLLVGSLRLFNRLEDAFVEEV